MKKLIFIFILLMSFVNLYPQSSLDSVLFNLNSRNKSIQTYNEYFNSQILLNNTGIFLKDPTIEMKYLFGNSSTEGDQMEFTVKQSFDFPLVYSVKSETSDLKNTLEGMKKQYFEKSVKKDVTELFIELEFIKELKSELLYRKSISDNLLNSYSIRYENNDATTLEMNKIKLQIAIEENKYSLLELDEETVKSKLKQNFGGMFTETYQYLFSRFDTLTFSGNIREKFLENNLQLKIKELEEKIISNNIRISSYESLPKFEVGYHYEKMFNQILQGPHLGISIPLWENKNKAAFGEAEKKFKKSDIEEYKFTELSLLNSNIIRTKKLKLLIEQLNLNMQTLKTVDILNDELSLGKITLIQYFNEINLHSTLRDKQIELRKEYYTLVNEILFRTEK